MVVCITPPPPHAQQLWFGAQWAFGRESPQKLRDSSAVTRTLLRLGGSNEERTVNHGLSVIMSALSDSAVSTIMVPARALCTMGDSRRQKEGWSIVASFKASTLGIILQTAQNPAACLPRWFRETTQPFGCSHHPNKT